MKAGKRQYAGAVLPEWPEWLDGDEDRLGYQRELSVYWESRCRLAVEALEQYARTTYDVYRGPDCRAILNAIGPLPPEGKP